MLYLKCGGTIMENYEAEFYQLELVYNKVCSANKSISSIEELNKAIAILYRNVPWNMRSYGECLRELENLLFKLNDKRRLLRDIPIILEENQSFLEEAKEICKKYMNPLRVQGYNASKYTTQYRKEHYKQLNVDLFPEDKEAFVKAVEYNGDKIKNVLRKFILNYISETDKKRREKEQENNNT